MKYTDITAVIVTYKSDKVIFKCLDSIRNIKKIIIIDNSNDTSIKKKILSKFPNINIILSKKNLGYGSGNNLALKIIKTKYALILNPDTILSSNCIYELRSLAKKINDNFSIISPSVKKDKNNYGFFSDKKNYQKSFKTKDYFKVDYVRGFAMFLNLQKINKIKYFDENFFMYLEEVDLCKRLYNIGENIYVAKRALVRHAGAKSSSLGFDFEINRNWHWMWSKVYYSSKHDGFFISRILAIPTILKLITKCIFYIIFLRKRSFLISFYRLWGLFSSFIGLKSFYRIKLS